MQRSISHLFVGEQFVVGLNELTFKHRIPIAHREQCSLNQLQNHAFTLISFQCEFLTFQNNLACGITVYFWTDNCDIAGIEKRVIINDSNRTTGSVTLKVVQ
jgi:hypothetical protein